MRDNHALSHLATSSISPTGGPGKSNENRYDSRVKLLADLENCRSVYRTYLDFTSKFLSVDFMPAFVSLPDIRWWFCYGRSMVVNL